MKILYSIVSILSLALSACGSNIPASTPVRLTVFAAASLTDAFTEIAAAFEATHPNTDVVLNFGGSNTLRAQIEQGAPADVFASANLSEMNGLVSGGMVATPVTFAHNILVVVVPNGNPASITGPADLARPGLKVVLAAGEVPAGLYARQVLAKYGRDYIAQVLNNTISNEPNVRQALAKVQQGEADAGIVYASDAASTDQVDVIEFPIEYNVIADYPIATLSASPDPAMAQAFVDFVLSSEGQGILIKWGFVGIK